MKKITFLFFIFFLFITPSNAKDKIYCLDLDNFGDDWKIKTSKTEYHFIAYEVIDRNNSKKCNDNVPSSIKNHRFLEIDEKLYSESKSKDKGYFSPGDAFTEIAINDLREYFKKNNIKIDFDKLVEKKIKALADAEDLSKKKSQERRSKQLKAELCRDKINYSWNIYKLPNMATFEFTSSCDKATNITELIVYTSDGKEMTKYTPPDGYIRPFGVKTFQFYIGDLNKDLISTASYRNKIVKTKVSSKKPVNKINNESDKYDWVAYIVFIIIGSILLGGVYSVYGNKKEISSNKSNVNKKISLEKNIIEKVWSGNETMSKTFWLYCILFGIVVGGVTGVLVGLYSNLYYLLAAIYIFWSNIGLWNSSNKYRDQKLSKKQTYGWATAAKVYVVFNFITTISQAGFILGGEY